MIDVYVRYATEPIEEARHLGSVAFDKEGIEAVIPILKGWGVYDIAGEGAENEISGAIVVPYAGDGSPRFEVILHDDL